MTPLQRAERAAHAEMTGLLAEARRALTLADTPAAQAMAIDACEAYRRSADRWKRADALIEWETGVYSRTWGAA